MSGEVCNIGPRGVKSRAVGGWVMLAVAAGMMTYFLVEDTDPIWRLTVFVPAFVGCLSLFQAQAGT